VSGSTIGFRVAKISGFTITYPSTQVHQMYLAEQRIVIVIGSLQRMPTLLQWQLSRSSNTTKWKETVGFTATRKTGVPSNTSQNITVTIIYGSAGEEKSDNNTKRRKSQLTNKSKHYEHFAKNSNFLVCLTLVSVKIQAQDVSINIINQPSTVTQGSTLGRVTVDICNNDGEP
jgi:hypothetical protein